MDLISVIVPVYNCEKYIKACCNSIIKQTYPNLEIILVNDGSKDRSASIIENIVQKHCHLRIINTCNRGVASARNVGIEYASGKYICFVDGDDLLPRQAIERLYKKITADQADYCQGSIMSIHRVRNHLVEQQKNKYADRNDYDSWRSIVGNLFWGPVAALYKAKIIKDNQIQFPSGIKFGEDSIFLANYLQYCSRVSTCAGSVYLYNRMRSFSASRTGYEKTWEWLYMFTQAYEKLYPDEYKYKKSAVEEIALRNIDYAFSHYAIYCQNYGKAKILFYFEICHSVFYKYLNDFSSANIMRPVSLERIERYKSDLMAYDYENIYRKIISENSRRCELFDLVKNVFCRIRSIRYFGI